MKKVIRILLVVAIIVASCLPSLAFTNNDAKCDEQIVSAYKIEP